MATILYKSISALETVNFNYNLVRDKNLETRVDGYLEGYNFVKLQGLENFQDVVVNRNSCLVLTSSVNLSSFFSESSNVNIGDVPGCIKLQTQYSNIYYADYNKNSNTFTFDSEKGAGFTVLPVKNGAPYEVEIVVNNLYLQVDESYPFTVRLGDYITNSTEAYRQRFFCYYQNNTIILKTKTNVGYRYLSTGEDNILRATGVLLNDVTVNSYIFKTFNFTTDSFIYNFIPRNDWVTYFLDFSDQGNNNNLVVNKQYNTVTNFLIDFPIRDAIKHRTNNINIANLKTAFSPTGSPVSIDNSYTEPNITSN